MVGVTFIFSARETYSALSAPQEAKEMMLHLAILKIDHVGKDLLFIDNTLFSKKKGQKEDLSTFIKQQLSLFMTRRIIVVMVLKQKPLWEET